MSRIRNVIRPLTMLSLALGAWLLAGASARAEGVPSPLRDPLKELAEKIKDLAGDQAVTVGEFAPPADGQAAGGAGIQQILTEELQAAKVRVENGADAPLEIDGRFRKAKNPDANNEEELLVQVSVVDKASGDEKGKFKAFINDAFALIPAYGATGTSRNSADGPRKAVPASIEHPAVYVNGGAAKTTEDSPYSLQVFIKETDPTTDQPRYTPCPAREQNRQAHIDLDLGQVYVVVVTNKSEEDAGVQLYIDGLDFTTFQEELNPVTGLPFSRMVVAAGKSATINGWFHTRQKSREFEVTRGGSGEASHLLGSSAKIGTITAVFSPRWKASENTFTQPGPLVGGETGDETKQGKEVAGQVKAVDFRAGPPVDWITVRYNHPSKGGN